jgi:hypothetical protein
MRRRPFKSLQDIPTHSNRTSEAENPHRKFLQMANLELRKTLCSKVREAAKKRAEEMDKKIAELEAEQSRILCGVQLSEQAPLDPIRGSQSARDHGSAQRCGFALKY